MKNRKLWLLVGGIILVLVLAVTPLMAGCAPAEEEKPPVEEEKPPEKVFELVYSTLMPEVSVPWLAHSWWMDEIEKRTNGRVLFTERYHSAQLFGGIDALSGLGRGVCNVAPIFPVFTPAELNMLGGVGLPLAVDNAGVQLMAKTEMMRTDSRLIEEATRNNIYLLAADLTGFWHVATTEKHITKFEDLAGLELWTILPYLVAAWDGIPVVLDAPEIYGAVEKGVVGGTLHLISDVYAFRIFELCKYYTEVGIGPFDATWTTSVNLDTWNSFPSDIQKIFHDTIDATTPYCFEIQKINDANFVKVFREAGMILDTLPPEEIAKVKALAPAIADWWVNLIPEQAEARQQLVQDFLDIAARTTVPPEWDYDPRIYFK